jgi:uncharacterized delta-60 repeat protein
MGRSEVSLARRVRLAVPLTVAALVAPLAGAGAGTGGVAPDRGFGNGGKVVIPPPPGANEYANAAAVLPDGSVIVAGTAVPDPDALPRTPSAPPVPLPPEAPVLPSVPSLGGSLGSVFLLYRVRADGTLDPAFGNQGRVWSDLYKVENAPVGDQVPEQYPVGSSGGYAMAVQPDGRIIVAGTTASATSFAFALVRYLPDGTVDRSFGQKGLVVTEVDPLEPDAVAALALGSDGAILAGGISGDRAALVRYRADGTLDESFGEGDGIALTEQGLLGIGALALDRQGRILAAGQGGVIDGPYDFGLARYRPDGTLDGSFGDGGVTVTDLGGTGEAASGVALGPGGTVVTAGYSSSSYALARHHADGTLDRSFGRDGLVTASGTGSIDSGGGRAFLSAPDGRILMAGGRWGGNSRDVSVVRYLSGGTRDATFGAGGVVTTDVVADGDDEATAVRLGAGAGNLVVAGTSYRNGGETARVFVVRYALG